MDCTDPVPHTLMVLELVLALVWVKYSALELVLVWRTVSDRTAHTTRDIRIE